MSTQTPDSTKQLQKALDNIVMAVTNFGHQVINEQHTDKKSYVYGTPDPLVITRVEAVPMLMQLFTAHTETAVQQAGKALLERLRTQLDFNLVHVNDYAAGLLAIDAEIANLERQQSEEGQ